jgi:hypothetical protein
MYERYFELEAVAVKVQVFCHRFVLFALPVHTDYAGRY